MSPDTLARSSPSPTDSSESQKYIALLCLVMNFSEMPCFLSLARGEINNGSIVLQNLLGFLFFNFFSRFFFLLAKHGGKLLNIANIGSAILFSFLSQF
jgi:hypothetical protein